jgi:predicted AAA+ superfamily ATPase
VRGAEKKAIEVKTASRLREEHFRGLRAIADLKGLKRRVLVYLGRSRQRSSDGIEIWPFDDFSRSLRAGTL